MGAPERLTAPHRARDAVEILQQMRDDAECAMGLYPSDRVPAALVARFMACCDARTEITRIYREAYVLALDLLPDPGSLVARAREALAKVSAEPASAPVTTGSTDQP